MTEAEFWARPVEGAAGCLLFPGRHNGRGYIAARFQGRQTYVHRLAYEFARGPIPAGLTIHHTCHVRHCVNPEHLELATLAENSREGGLHRRQTHCKRGHSLEGAPLRQGYPRCRPCDRLREYCVPATCEHCSGPFMGKRGQRFCGPTCRNKARARTTR